MSAVKFTVLAASRWCSIDTVGHEYASRRSYKGTPCGLKRTNGESPLRKPVTDSIILVDPFDDAEDPCEVQMIHEWVALRDPVEDVLELSDGSTERLPLARVLGRPLRQGLHVSDGDAGDAEAALREELRGGVESRVGFPKNARLGESDVVEP